jgi:hypothetical protein
VTSDDDRPTHREEEPDDEDDEDTPETPLDEPAPTPIQDPPAEADKGPYIVHIQGKTMCHMMVG